MITSYGDSIRVSDVRHKYSSAIAEYCWVTCLGGCSDDVTGSDDFGLTVSRLGRRLVCSDEQGFVWVERFVTERQAIVAFLGIDEDYGKWSEVDLDAEWL